MFFKVAVAKQAARSAFTAKCVSLLTQSARKLSCTSGCKRNRCARRLRLALTVYALTNSAVGLILIIISGLSPTASWCRFGIGSTGRRISSRKRAPVRYLQQQRQQATLAPSVARSRKTANPVVAHPVVLGSRNVEMDHGLSTPGATASMLAKVNGMYTYALAYHPWACTFICVSLIPAYDTSIDDNDRNHDNSANAKVQTMCQKKECVSIWRMQRKMFAYVLHRDVLHFGGRVLASSVVYAGAGKTGVPEG